MPADRRGPRPGLRLFVRRVSDEASWWGRRKCYEVGYFLPDDPTPVEIRRTRKPGLLLSQAGVHSTDNWDYVQGADLAWTGRVGPWRGIFPHESP